MQTLIRNGVIHSMSPKGTFQGDVLLSDDAITRVAPHIKVCEEQLAHIVDARGLHICPGLIDAHIHLIRAADHVDTDVRAMSKAALAAGITSCALWQDSGKECLLLQGDTQVRSAGIRYINAERMREDPLVQALQEAKLKGMAAGCEVHSEAALDRLLRVKDRTGCRVILVHLSQCMNAEEKIISSGCSVILGACSLRGKGSAYELAMRLQRQGVTCAVTTDYPTTRLHYLPWTAGLCRRIGMTTDEALRTITLDAAAVLGLQNTCGSIEVGKRADLTIFDGDPLLYSSSRAMTICGGEMA